MIKRLTKSESSQNQIYFIIAFLMMIVFCSIYGMRILDPSYTDWLMSGGDLTQHYLGWKAYRMSRWMFPIGCMDNLSYPHQMSVIFTDSIPCFAVFFKLLSPVLPADFQYFGIWGLLSFILQGILSAKIISHFTKNKFFMILASLLFAFTPVMIWRMYAHTALAGHWILLLALETVFACRSYSNNKKIFRTWAVIGILAPAIHIYFVLMCGMILLGYCVMDTLTYKRLKRNIFVLVAYLLPVIGTVWILGGFMPGVTSDSTGLGALSANLNALFNPQGWSCIYKDLPLYATGQYEGFAYLGAGAIVLFFAAMLGLSGISELKKSIFCHWNEICAIGFMILISVVFALSPVFTFGERMIIEWKLPEILIKCWSVFRSSGRMIWVAVYIILICSFGIILKVISDKRVLVTLLSFCVLCQIYDMHVVLSDKNSFFNQKVVYRSALKDTVFWDNLGANQNVKHIIFTENVSLDSLYAFTDWALKNDKTVNQFYFARQLNTIDTDRQNDLEHPDDSELFIFSFGNTLECLKYDLNYYLADGFVIGYTGTTEYGKKMSKSDLNGNIWTFADNQYLQNGQDDGNGTRSVYAGGISYGPYWEVPSGNYTVTISGKNLKKADIEIYSQKGEKYHNYTMAGIKNERVVLEIHLEKQVKDLEIAIKNNTQEIIELNQIHLRGKE